MKRKSISKLILKISEGIVARVVDIILLGFFYFEEMAPYSKGGLREKLFRIEKDFGEINYSTLKRALTTCQQKGWISKDLKITLEGQKRLNSILPKYFGKKEWNGKWYIVTYDIPEKKRHFRNILREKLERLGFGQLQKSVWVSPRNFLGDIEELIKKYNLSSFVLLAVSNKLGREPSRDLAEKIWKVEKLNDDYKKFIEEVKSKKLSKKEVIFKYLATLSRDPQLPSDLLPDDWRGEVAYKIYRKFGKKGLKELITLIKS